MKKSLVLAMAMALGVTASAYAANPFSDVPAGHWAYDSISKLAAAGVIEGYGDATFGGDKLMTRYEMAQIVAKAMAKGANCDKLAAEFADELDNLGVRVANLEKKADNVKITGQVRYSYKDVDEKGAEGRFRTRLLINGAINEDWTYTGRLENNQYHTDKITETTVDKQGNAAENGTDFNWAYVTGKVGGVKVTAGRQDFKLHTGMVVDNTFDGISAAYGKDIKVTGYVGKACDFTGAADDRFYALDVATKLGAFNTYVSYYKVDAEKDTGNYPAMHQDIYVLGADTKIAKDLTLKAEYMRGKSDIADELDFDKNGYVVGLAYKGAKASAPGSWGVWANYMNLPQVTTVKNTITAAADLPAWTYVDPVTGNDVYSDGFKGYEVGANYAVAKNMVAAVKYYDLEGREGEAEAKTLWGEVTFSF